MVLTLVISIKVELFIKKKKTRSSRFSFTQNYKISIQFSKRLVFSSKAHLDKENIYFFSKIKKSLVILNIKTC